MDQIAERGVAAHWTYKAAEPATAAQTRAREWVEGLVEAQTREASSIEFLENVKVDLFPDEVYLFTPKGHILALPRNATALDFAFAVHTDVGTHAVAARVDKKLVPLRQRLNSGESVEIITAPSAQPNPQWLEWVVSARARTAIRHFLKRLQHEDAVEFGHRMLDRALDARGLSLDAIPSAVLDRFLERSALQTSRRTARRHRARQPHARSGRRDNSPTRTAARRTAQSALRASEKILITGAERGVLSFGNCCYPVPGDEIFGYLSSGKGIVVHRLDCPNAPEYRKTPERIVAIGWDREVSGDYRARLRIVVDNKPGVLATVAAAIAERDSNIENVEYQERDQQTSTLMFTIEVRNRKHLAAVMRRVRNAPVVHAVYRYP